MADQSAKLTELMGRIPLKWKPPATGEGRTLLEEGLLCILTRHVTAPQAEKSLRALRAQFPDWNELRVTQVQEFADAIATKSRAAQLAAAADLRTYLQEIFQKNHGFDIEFLRTDVAEGSKFVLQLDFLGASAGHYLLWVASGGSVPASTGVIRVLDRLGVMKRTSSVKKAQAALDPLVPAEKRIAFGTSFGLIVERWCDAKKPACWECPLVDGCPHGAKVHREWKVQQERLEAQRKKEEERRRKEEEKERRRAEAEAKKRAALLAKQRAADERKRKAEEARKAREEEKRQKAKQRAAEKAAREAARKKEQIRKEAQRKKDALRKAAAAKKAAAKKAALAKKKAASMKAAAAKKKKVALAKKKAAAKAAAAKKKAMQAKKKATKAKKKVAKKPARKSTPKRTAKKTPARKSAKKAAKKATKKKAAKKKTTKKKVAKKKKATKRRR